MTRRRNGLGVILGVGGLATAMSLALPASAHISLEQAGTHKSRYGDGELKDGPCGRKGGSRGTNVYTYAPGQKITISVLETIVHPGYFRIAFDDDGDDAFIEPASIKPVDPARKCPSGAGDHCGMSDFYNSPAVLPGMDNLNPHITAASGAKYTWDVTLPNVECTNCTLQLIQVMEDDAFHGPYDPTPGVGVEDIYHQCIDLVLKRSADGGTGPSDATTTDIRTPPGDSGGAGAGGTSADAGRPDSGTGSGGTTTGSGGAAGTGGSTTGTGGSGGGTSGGSGGTGGSGTGSGGTGAGASGGTGSGATGGAGSGATGGAGSGGSAGAGAAAGSGGTGPDGGENGCKCTISGGRASRNGLAAFALLGLALASRRRRR